MTNFGRFIASTVKFLVYIVSRFVKVIALILIGAIAVSIGALIISGHFGLPYLSLIAPNPPISGYIGYYGGIIAFGIIPLILLIKSAINFIGGYKTSLKFKRGLSGIWIVSFMIFILTGVFTLRNFVHDASKTELLSEVSIDKDKPLEVGIRSIRSTRSARIQFGPATYLTNGKFYNGEDIDVFFEPVDADQPVKITKTTYSRGMNHRSAIHNMDYPRHQVELSENQLDIDELYEIGKRDKYRVQKLRYDIAVPIGTTMAFKSPSSLFSKRELRKRGVQDQVWIMTENGLELSEEIQES